MFKENLSDEAYLDFYAKYGHCDRAVKMYVDKTYIAQHQNGSQTTASLIGYAAITGGIPDNNPWALLYEPSLDTYFVPIRYAEMNRIFFFGHIGFTTGVHLFIEELTPYEVQSLKNGIREAVFVSTPTKRGWKIGCKMSDMAANV